MTCTTEGCTRPAWIKKRGLCRPCYHRDWHARHPDYHAQRYHATKPSRLIATIDSATKGTTSPQAIGAYRTALRADTCSYCGAPGAQLDHITPRARSGPNDWDNLTSACAPCNTFKRDRSLLGFMLTITAAPPGF